jgi:hypothetical protein
MTMNATVTATRDGDTIVIRGLTHDGFRREVQPQGRGVVIPAMTTEHRWIVVCTAGQWVPAESGRYEFREYPGTVTFHRAYRCEAASHGDAATVRGGRVIAVQSN